ncbi:uncharacterized protein TNCV_785481 [Trichonephila clavipes]|nr:uncharacterized protein TNCV_785481 [Trichonephila clavipes]
MAALVSEYTLEFFTLLNARGKKELIEWCMKEGLIASSYECPKCNEQMGLNERKSVVLDGFEWRCRKKATRKLMVMDLVILNIGQVTWTTPELISPSPNYPTTPTGGPFSTRQIQRASLSFMPSLQRHYVRTHYAPAASSLP